MESSVLECLGVEIIGVMSPVSICMFLVVLLVYSLSSPSTADTATTFSTAANLVYAENPSDSAAQKLEGAVLNAVVFVILIALVTFLLVVLYYYNCTSFLRHYTRFSAFFVLATMGGSILLSLLQRFSLPLDAVTAFLLLFNFSVVGVLSVFSGGFPILLRQSYMVCLGIIVATWFTKLPEWTTWTLLVALALYDLVAVLAPGGPLKLLVELASTRNEELPALVYEARPTTTTTTTPARNPHHASAAVAFIAAAVGVSDTESSRIELQVVSRDNVISEYDTENESSDGINDEGERSPLVGGMRFGEEMSPLVDVENNEEEEEEGVRRIEIGERGIKLGLGDFVFYSVLVGRAAMYDLMTVYACYLAIISGLGCTLILLSVCRQALPALPISIALGVLFYFLTRLLMEPFIVGTATNLMMF